MSGTDAAPVPFDEIVVAAQSLAAEPEWSALAARFLSRIQSWAQPSLVLCAVRDASAEGGIRVVPELTSGPPPHGVERQIAKLIEESPPVTLSRPMLVRPDEAPGVKVRDTWVVPWSAGPASGLLFLRGLPSAYPPNLPDAVALLGQSVWPHLASRTTPPAPLDAAQVERLLGAFQGAAERLGDEAKRGLEALRAATAPAPTAPPAPAEPDPALAERLAAAEKERSELAARLETAEKALAQTEAERAFSQGEASDMRARLEAAEKQREEARSEAATLRERAHALDSVELEREAAVGAVVSERRKVQDELAHLQGRAESAERAVKQEREHHEAERSALERSLQDAQGERDQGRGALEQAESRRAAAERERDDAKAAFAASLQRVKQVEAEVRGLAERWDKTSEAFHEAFIALRRTPFVPPTLRVSFAEVEGILDPEGSERRAAGNQPQVLVLDRDTSAIQGLAGELASAGLEVLIAHYPEEVAFFLKTPEARLLTALVCDVMAFRPDQNLTELFKSWRHDQPALGMFPSFKADNSTEAERAQRIPSTLTAGFLPRPLQRETVVEAVMSLARRSGRS